MSIVTAPCIIVSKKLPPGENCLLSLDRATKQTQWASILDVKPYQKIADAVSDVRFLRSLGMEPELVAIKRY